MTLIPAPTNPVDPGELAEVIEVGSLATSLKFATPEEALAGEETAKMMSPATTKHVLDNGTFGGGYPINDGSDGLEELWSASYLTGSVGDTAAMLDGILGDGDEIASLKGEDGTDGATIIVLTVDPTTEGNIGDICINKTTMQIFGPKAIGGDWGVGTNLIGAAGQDGVNGRTILSGTVDPTTEGVDNDFYLNRTSMQIFGPKASGAWGAGVSLRGADGADGAIGPTFSINENHFFADATARDAYFTSNPSELVASVVISIESGSTGYQQYSGSAWIDKEFAVSGGGGGVDLSGKYLFAFSSTLTGPYGQASNRTTGSAYSYQQAVVTFISPFIATEIWWDTLPGTFELFIDGVSMGSETNSTTGALIFTVDKILSGGVLFKIVKDGAAVKMRDGPEDTQNAVFKLPSTTYYDTTLANYQLPLRVKGYRSVVEAAPTA